MTSEHLRPGRSNPPLFMFAPLRTGVLRSMEAGAYPGGKVLTLVAPVGYGKTVLMSLLHDDLRRAGKQCLWYAMDDRDLSIDGVLAALSDQLSRHESRLHPTQALFRGEEPVERRIEGLMQLVDLYPLPLTLFIDNLNCCHDPALSRLIDQLVFHSRPSLQLVMSSTRDIPFDVSRAQLQGMLRQIGPEELAFRPEEVAQLLGSELGQQIGPSGVDTVTRRTEGWPAAVRMAQIILHNASNPVQALSGFSGSDEALAHLLNRQVLSGFSDELRAFLLCIARLRSFNLELCREAVGTADVDRHLAYLVERNVFVIPLDRNRSWYRLHGLFRDFLLQEASRTLDRERLQDVLARAARWCHRHGYWHDAVDYALASGSGPLAVQILEQIAARWVRDLGQVPQYLRWIEELRELGQEPGPEASFWYVWALTFHRRYDQARQQVGVLATRVQRQPGKTGSVERQDLLRRIAILKTSIDSLSDHLLEAHDGAAQWLAGVSSSQDDPFNLTAAQCIESTYLYGNHRFLEARRALQAARESAFQANSTYVDGWVSTYTCLTTIHEGDYASAYREMVPTLTATRAALGEDAGICGTMAMVAAKCAVEMGLTEEARQLLLPGLKTARTHGFLDATACGLEAGMLLWSGTDDDALGLSRLRDIAACYPQRLSLMLSCYLIQRLIVLGNTEAARFEAEKIGLFVSVPIDANAPGNRIASMAALLEDTTLALMVASGRLDQASQAVEQAWHHAKAAHCTARQVTLALTAATVEMRRGEHPNAVRHVTRAVSLAAPRSIIRPFLDRMDTLAAVVADTKLTAWGFANDCERRFFADRCRPLTFTDASLFDRLTALNDEEPHLVSKLTTREIELLSYIEAGLSNQQIADRIGVALTTVKWHLKNLFVKLSVTNRVAALSRARVLKVL